MTYEDEQLENEGTESQEEVDTSEQAPVEQTQDGTPQGNEGSDDEPEFVLDENGNLQWNTDDDDESESEESPAKGQPSDEDTDSKSGNPSESHYKVKIGGKEQEVTLEELTKGYMRQADYTRKTQELAERRKAIQDVQQVPQQFTSNQMAGQQQSGPDLNALAKHLAAQKLGLKSEDDLSELDFDHQMAVFEAKQNLVNQRNQMVSREVAMKNLENQLRSEDPAYDEIMANAKTRMETVPYKQYRALQSAYEQGNPEPIRAFYNNVLKKEYYANAIEKVDSKKKPVPKVEHAGAGVPQNQGAKRVDFSKLGAMSSEQKAKFLMDMGFLDD